MPTRKSGVRCGSARLRQLYSRLAHGRAAAVVLSDDDDHCAILPTYIGETTTCRIQYGNDYQGEKKVKPGAAAGLVFQKKAAAIHTLIHLLALAYCSSC